MFNKPLKETFNKVFNDKIEERWARPRKKSLPTVEVRGRFYHYEKCKENSPYSFVLHGKNGARYGLIGENGVFIALNSRTKKVVEKVGKFKFTENGLQWINPKSIVEGRTMIINEGGNAATNLIPKLIDNGASENIKFSKIPANQMGALFKEVVRPILSELSGAGMLAPEYKSEFGIGSTRLAALSAGEKVKLLPSEDKKTIAKALKSKKSFGDLDIDVVLRDGVSIKDVGNYLQSHYPDTIAFRTGSDEINLAYVWDGDKVIQIDLVDVTGPKKNKLEFEQSSSLVDIAEGVKGVFQSILLRSILMVKDLTNEEKQQVREAIETNPEIQKWISNGYDFKVPGIDTPSKTGRWQLGGNGIGIVVDLFKPGRKEGTITKKTIKLSDTPTADFSNVDALIDAILPGATLDTINSAVRLAKTFKNKYPKKVPELWDEYKKSMERLSDSIDEDDYNHGMAVLSKILGVGE